MICNRVSIRILFLAAMTGGFGFFHSSAFGQTDINQAPINYQSAQPTDVVAQLAKRIEQGKTKLSWDKKHGWLPALLDELKVSRKSQTLVFSKTSQQLRKIHPSRPRALYFNDETYLGWVQDGDFVEIATVDDQLGAVFYTLTQKDSKRPEIRRDTQNCLSCHATRKTKDVPGFLVRSVYPKSDGHPEFRLGTLTTDHRTDLKDRFGGWYVTGSHGKIRHRGNVVFSGDTDQPLPRDKGANLKTVPAKVRIDDYLESTSDIVALMVLEHQSQFHNLVTKASYECRKAIHYQAEMNRIFERKESYLSDSTIRRINGAAEKLVRYILYCDEHSLESPIKGNAEFAKQFLARANKDKSGRSLRDFDLKKRMFKYPCSYLIHTKSFKALPKPILNRVRQRMIEVLTGKDNSEPFEHLSETDRKNILAILGDTHPLFQTKESKTRDKTSTPDK